MIGNRSVVLRVWCGGGLLQRDENELYGMMEAFYWLGILLHVHYYL
jgi:hypothetical protein